MGSGGLGFLFLGVLLVLVGEEFWFGEWEDVVVGVVVGPGFFVGVPGVVVGAA